MDEDERKTLSDIREYGCHVLHVSGEDDLPPFTYSVGISKTSHAPELIVVGLKQELALFVVNEYNRRVRNGEAIEDGQMHGGFIGGFDCLFRDVETKHYDEYFGWNQWLYKGNAFRVL